MLLRKRDSMRKLQTYNAWAGKNSLATWWAWRSPLKVAYNFILIYGTRYCPSLRLKNILLRLAGIKIGKGARIGLAATFDIFWPENIEIQDGALIGYNVTVLAHEFLPDKLRVGKTIIGKNALIGANSTVLAGVNIGNGAIVSAMTLVNKDVPAGAFAQGVPMKISSVKK